MLIQYKIRKAIFIVKYFTINTPHNQVCVAKPAILTETRYTRSIYCDFPAYAVAPYLRTPEENPLEPVLIYPQYSPMNEKLGGGCQRAPTDAEL